jgi:hypothetical protein
MVSLRDLLVAGGAANLGGWQLISATGISNDGLTIVGNGTNPDGMPEAWVARIPEPETWVTAMIATLCALCFMRARSSRV